MSRSMSDVAFEHGIRFHVAPGGQFQQGEIMVAWPSTKDDPCAAILNMNEPWPAVIAIERVTAVIMKSQRDLGEASAFIAAHKAGVRQ
jgi:hypothetical protein